MKPKPFASLNHLTVPVVRIVPVPRNDVIGVGQCGSRPTKQKGRRQRRPCLITLGSVARALPMYEQDSARGGGQQGRSASRCPYTLCKTRRRLRPPPDG